MHLSIVWPVNRMFAWLRKAHFTLSPKELYPGIQVQICAWAASATANIRLTWKTIGKSTTERYEGHYQRKYTLWRIFAPQMWFAWIWSHIFIQKKIKIGSVLKNILKKCWTMEFLYLRNQHNWRDFVFKVFIYVFNIEYTPLETKKTWSWGCSRTYLDLDAGI